MEPSCKHGIAGWVVAGHEVTLFCLLVCMLHFRCCHSRVFCFLPLGQVIPHSYGEMKGFCDIFLSCLYSLSFLFVISSILHLSFLLSKCPVCMLTCYSIILVVAIPTTSMDLHISLCLSQQYLFSWDEVLKK